ncbi:thioesterase family protein [Geobacillus sp. TFV-3]|uniref:acyl-CoA thioesterase n=1 Tax=Geobacillus sp. TFV-3 TaxID=1897059 RepID=UPI00135C262F|nr:thioesterase family protein [Geobacillus sp. TFV-3]KAF0995279.1 1,4-dihydroxy-2-naphthoyl-CoA hydrolase [Geobacillus sp. TFV-3]
MSDYTHKRSKWLETTTKVRWSEVDWQGIVYYANYFVYFDLAREYLANSIGIDYLTDVDILTLECQAKFHAPARYGDELIIRVALEHPNFAHYVFHYHILRKTGRQLLVEGKSVHCVFDKEKQRIKLDVPDREKELFTKSGLFDEKR